MAANKLKEALLNAFAVTLGEVGEQYLLGALQELKDKHPEEYEACILGGHAFVVPLTTLVKKSKTKIDDGILEAIHEAIDASASENGIVLPDA